MEAPIIVRYQTNPALLSAGLNQLSRTMGLPGMWRSFGILWLIATIMGPAVLSGPWMNHLDKPLQYCVSAGIATVLILLLWWMVSRKKPGESHPSENIYLHFSEIGVDRRTNATESRMEWTAFSGFLESKDYYFLCYPRLHQRAALVAEFVPKAALQTREEHDRFRSLVSRKLQPQTATRRKRPISLVFLILLFVAVMLMLTVSKMGTPPRAKVTLAQYLDLKGRGMVQEVWISEKGVLTADLDPNKPAPDGLRRVYIELPRSLWQDDGQFQPLIQGIPESRVHDHRDE